MSAHTPGPWIHYDDSQDGKTNRHEIAARGKTIAHIYCSVPDQDSANARLIAAAPDLLDSVRKAIETFDDLERVLRLFQRAITADACKVAADSMRETLHKAGL
jgi:hypothetical protein